MNAISQEILNETWTKEELIKNLWKRGELSYKLRKEQIEILKLFEQVTALHFMALCARRFGKTYLAIVDAIQYGIKHTGVSIGFVAPTAKMLSRIVHPIIMDIMKDCPYSYKLEWDYLTSSYRIPMTDSRIYLSGTDNKKYEYLRGMNIHRGYIDEAAHATDYRYILDDILIPQLMTTGGKLLSITTPPRIYSDDYVFIKAQAQENEAFIKKTIDDNTSLSAEIKEHFIEELGGRGSDTVRRELYCEDVYDSDVVVFPEFDYEAEGEIVIDDFEIEKPSFWKWTLAIDPGYFDFTGGILGYYDFNKATYYIVRELFIQKATTEDIANWVKQVQIDISIPDSCISRWSDTDHRLTADLYRLHNIVFTATAKDNREARINEVRLAIKDRRVRIFRSCKNLIRQLKTCVRNRAGNDFERTKIDGHFDTIAALIYFVRNVNTLYNPYMDKRKLPQNMIDTRPKKRKLTLGTF